MIQTKSQSSRVITTSTVARFIVFLAPVAVAISAHAHPGHGLFEADAKHLLTSPDHFLVLALAGGLVCFGARFVQRRFPKRLLQLTGATAIAVAAMLWGGVS